LPMNEDANFEREIELELHRVLDPISAEPIPMRNRVLSGGIMKRLLGGAGAAIAAKAVTGFAVAALAASAAGAATEVAVTGSLNPADWGQQVKQAVATCKDTLRASGTRGIGKCVSAFASQHGKLVSGEHKASNARENHGNGNGNGKDKDKGNKGGNGNGNGNGNGGGQPGHKPTTTPGPTNGRRRPGPLPVFEG